MSKVPHEHPEPTPGGAKSQADSRHMDDQDILAAMEQIPGYLDITPGDFKEVFVLAYTHARKRMLSAPARTIMTSPVHSVPEDLPVVEVARLLDEKKVAGVPVTGSRQRVVGVISEKDFMHRMTRQGQSFMGLVASCMSSKGCPALHIKGQVAADIMSSPAVTVSSEAPLHEIFDLFQDKGINRVPVVDQDRLTGIVSRDDVLKALASLQFPEIQNQRG